MRALRVSVVMLCVLAWPASALAQAAAAAKPQAVIQHIPAGALGYVVVNNVQSATDKIDQFLSDIGASMLVFTGPASGVLEMIQGAVGLGEGFNPNGGFAAVLLDPKPFGIDLVQSFQGGGAEKVKPPVVLLIPGTDVKGIFPKAETKPAGKYATFTLGGEPAYAMAAGSYVLLSPEARYLDAVLQSSKKAGDELPKEHAAGMVRSDFAVHINMKLAGPIINQQFEQLTAMAPVVGPPEMLKQAMAFYRDMISQVSAVTMTGRIAETGAVLEAWLSFGPETSLGQAISTYKPPAEGNLLNRLPNLPYVLAGGGAGPQATDESLKLQADMLDVYLKAIHLPDETKARIKQNALAFHKEVRAMQFVIGGAPEGTGAFGVSCVIQCKNSAAVRKLLADAVPLGEQLIGAALPMPPVGGPEGMPPPRLTLSYQESAETIGGAPVDVIAVQVPMFPPPGTEEAAGLIPFLGEDALRVRVAAPDAHTVVVTLGGAAGFLNEAIIQATKGTGNILLSKDAAEAMAHMPKNRAGLVLLNAGNLFTVIDKAMQAMGPGAMIPFRINTTTPIALGVGIAGSTEHMVLYVPKNLIKEVVGLVMMFQGPMGPPPGAPGARPQGPEDF